MEAASAPAYSSRENGVIFEDFTSGKSVELAWINPDDGLLVIDANDSGTVDQLKEFVFTEWSVYATTDAEAIAEVFDTNRDYVLDSQDELFEQFKNLERRKYGWKL